MLTNRRKSFEDRVIRDLTSAFPTPEPDKHRFLIEKDRFSFYLFDSRPREGNPDDWTKTPVAKFSFLERDNLWQLSWMPPQGRWQKYGRYFDLDTATIIIKGDPAGCFLGEYSPSAYLHAPKEGEAAAPDAPPATDSDASAVAQP